MTANETVPSTVVFFHAHPDDEAIFTGGTMRLLANAGHRVVLLLATSGEHGLIEHIPQEGGDLDLAGHRRAETDEAARLLGVSDIVHLGYQDSGLGGGNPDGFRSVPSEAAALRAEELLARAEVVADALVVYDDHGIYGHPDHIAVYDAGMALASRLAASCVYEATVDREYLHFVESHLVIEAGLPEWPSGLGLAASDLGRPTVLIDTEIDVRSVLDAKRAAMAAHRSQIPESSSALRLASASFADVYGLEWYVRRGAPGPLDSIAGT